MPSDTKIVGFADDIAVVVVAKERAAAEENANGAIRAIEAWLSNAGLELAAHKKEAVLISSRKKIETAEVLEHLQYAQKKASGTVGALSRMLLNTRGPKQSTRRLLTSVITAQLLYAPPTLCHPVLVLAGLVPLRELIREKANIRAALRGQQGADSVAKAELKSAARKRSYGSWQALWDASSKGRWTHRMIPNIEAWMERKHEQLPGMRIWDNGGCLHVIFDCRRFDEERDEMEAIAGTAISVDTLVPLMLADPRTWEAAAEFAAKLMRFFMALERSRREQTG
ncbi:uncharacterized protein [Drosophila kikkawai]|uniref:Reverse transcriptase domain-containing protein n=1 Tax=Drosophila kikkawai TaxID=30033 RepID=A0ABM4GFT3_DROKI